MEHLGFHHRLDLFGLLMRRCLKSQFCLVFGFTLERTPELGYLGRSILGSSLYMC